MNRVIVEIKLKAKVNTKIK